MKIHLKGLVAMKLMEIECFIIIMGIFNKWNYKWLKYGKNYINILIKLFNSLKETIF